MDKKSADITLWERLKTLWEHDDLEVGTDPQWTSQRERIMVLVISGIAALLIWFVVNMNRDFTVNMEVPIYIGEVPPNMALAERLPEYTSISFYGQGWKLLPVYFSPPVIRINVSEDAVNLVDQVRQQMNSFPSVDVTEVQPSSIDVKLEPRSTKKVPVRARIEVSFKEQYGYLDQPKLVPDSVFLIGAESRIQDINEWHTQPVTLGSVREDINQTIPLEEPGSLVELSSSEVSYQAEVAEFTEGEVRTFIRTRNLPAGVNVNFTPSVITVKYDVPIEEYAETQDIIPYTAFVTYSQIESDTTGYVTPNVTSTTQGLHIRLRTFQPQKVGYFRVVDE
ncbi:MAG: CdaR family protein [Bacteroidota bacterium]